MSQKNKINKEGVEKRSQSPVIKIKTKPPQNPKIN